MNARPIRTASRDLAASHARVTAAGERLRALALTGETLGETMLRLGSQHPAVRERDFAIYEYRRATPWTDAKARG